MIRDGPPPPRRIRGAAEGSTLPDTPPKMPPKMPADSRPDLARLARSRPRRRWPWVLVLLALLGLGGWLWSSRGATPAAVTYDTTAVERGDLTVTVIATGTVQPTTRVEISSELSGTIAAVEADFNDEVTEGQVLARLDDTNLRARVTTAEAQLAAAAARVTQAEATASETDDAWASTQALDKRGLATRTTVVATRAAHDRAMAAVEIAAADLKLAEASLSEARSDLAKAAIRSPIDGIVLSRTAEKGQIVAATLNAPILFTLAEDLARMELRVDVDEADIGRVAVGNEARFTVDAFPGRSFPAVITTVRYAPETTDGVVTYKAILSVDNGEGLLRPGMTATATISVTVVEDTLRVPGAALRFEPPQVAATGSARGGNGLLGMVMPRRPSSAPKDTGGSDTPTVWVLRNGVATEVEVQPGESDGKLTAVASENLAEGDLVIVDQSTRG